MRFFECVDGPLDGKLLGRERTRVRTRLTVRDWRLNDPANPECVKWIPRKKKPKAKR